MAPLKSRVVGQRTDPYLNRKWPFEKFIFVTHILWLNFRFDVHYICCSFRAFWQLQLAQLFYSWQQTHLPHSVSKLSEAFSSLPVSLFFTILDLKSHRSYIGWIPRNFKFFFIFEPKLTFLRIHYKNDELGWILGF